MRLVLVGGGTAGHIFPTIAVAEQAAKIAGSTASLTAVCGSRDLDRLLYRDVELEVLPLSARGLVGVDWWRLPLARLAPRSVVVLDLARLQSTTASCGHRERRLRQRAGATGELGATHSVGDLLRRRSAGLGYTSHGAADVSGHHRV